MFMIDLTLAFTLKHGKFLVHKSEMTIVGGCLKQMKMFLHEYEDESAKVPKDIDDLLICMALFSVIWSVGAAVEETTRKEFNNFVLKMVNGAENLIDEYNLDLFIQLEYKP